MVTSNRVVRVTADTHLPDVLDEARVSPVVLEQDGVRFYLSLVPDMQPAGSDRETALAILDEALGTWADVDVDKVIQDIYEARDKGSRDYEGP